MKPAYLLVCAIAFGSVLWGQSGALNSVEGQVLSSAGGTPVRGAVVTLQISSGRAVRPGEPPQSQLSSNEVETDEQGRCAFRNLEAGGYRVTAQRQGFVTPSGVILNLSYSPLWLGEGQQLTGYVVRLTPQSVIAGKVLDEFGDPVMGAQVTAQRAGTGDGALRSVGSAQTNDLGEYRVANLSAGDYIVAASSRNTNRMYRPPDQALPDRPQMVYATSYHPGTAVVGEAATVHVADGGGVVGGVDVKLVKTVAFSVRGTIVDLEPPLNGAQAYAQLRRRDGNGLPNGGNFGASTTQDGSFQFDGVPPGSYDLSAQRANMGSGGFAAGVSVPIEVRDKNLDGIVLRLKPAADLQGSVKVEPSGECDLRNSTIGLMPAGGVSSFGGVPPVRVGDDLKFTLKSVPPGVYSFNLMGGQVRCSVKSVLYGGQTAPVTALAVSESGPLEITVAPYSATLNVAVVDRDGKPLPNARVSVVMKDGGRMTMGSVTSAAGQATFGWPAPGTYAVYAWEGAAQGVPQSPDYLKSLEIRAKTVTLGESGQVTVGVTAIPASESGATAVPPLPIAKGSLAGTVVHAVTGAPMARVDVTLRGQYSQFGPPQGTSVATDDQGRFAFPDLAPGSYSVTPLEQRFLAGFEAPMNPATQVIVGEGQQVSAYVLKLFPAAVIAGAVTDESGEPVLGAWVQVYRYRNDMGQRRMASAGGATTDDLGKYRVASLPPGNYYVRAARLQINGGGLGGPSAMGVAEPAISFNGPAAVGPGALSASTQVADSITGPLPSEAETEYLPVWYAKGAQSTVGSAVRLAVGATAANIDMTLRKTRVVRIRGKVVDAAGAAVGMPSVTLMTADPRLPWSSVGRASIARDGGFEISAVPPGRYLLTARPGFGGGSQTAQLNAVRITGSGTVPGGPSVRMALQFIEVKDSPIDGIKLELSAGRTVKGSIKMDGGGAVPRPAFFSLTPLQGGMNAPMNTGGDGTFTLSDVFPLVYTLNPQSLPANCYVKSIRYAGQELPRTGFELIGDGQLEIVLANTAAVLEGAITGADGKPAANAGIAVAPVDGSWPMRTGNADAHGNFYFANLSPGDYRVVAWDAMAPEAADPPESLGQFASAAKNVTLGEGAHEKLQVAVVPAGR